MEAWVDWTDWLTGDDEKRIINGLGSGKCRNSEKISPDTMAGADGNPVTKHDDRVPLVLS